MTSTLMLHVGEQPVVLSVIDLKPRHLFFHWHAPTKRLVECSDSCEHCRSEDKHLRKRVSRWEWTVSVAGQEALTVLQAVTPLSALIEAQRADLGNDLFLQAEFQMWRSGNSLHRKYHFEHNGFRKITGP